LSHHPIDPTIRAEIMARLADIESTHGVRVLFACESGSRGWGFASPDSDYDVRFLYVHPLPWYLSVSDRRDVIEQPVSAVFDVSGWDLKKALTLLRGGNATLIEWLDSPVVYRADEAFLAAMRAAAEAVHRPERSFHHYLHMARKNYREHLQGEAIKLKKYLYVLRPVLAATWIEQGRGVAPMVFEQLVEVLVEDAALKQAIAELLAFKRQVPESETGPPIPLIQEFLSRELVRLESVAPGRSEPGDAAVLDRLLFEVVTGQKLGAQP
jgi:uncharacterized protein